MGRADPTWADYMEDVYGSVPSLAQEELQWFYWHAPFAAESIRVWVEAGTGKHTRDGPSGASRGDAAAFMYSELGFWRNVRGARSALMAAKRPL